MAANNPAINAVSDETMRLQFDPESGSKSTVHNLTKLWYYKFC